MLSIIVVAQSDTERVTRCLHGLLESIDALGCGPDVEIVLVDNSFGTQRCILPLLVEFRRASLSPVVILKFGATHDDAHVWAHAMAVGQGEHLLMLDDCSIVNPSCIRTLLAVALLSSEIGVVRSGSVGTRASSGQQILSRRSVREAMLFAEWSSERDGLAHAEMELLTRDVMLVTRAALDRVGVYDPGQAGVFGEVDYGLRVQRAGLKLVHSNGAYTYRSPAPGAPDAASGYPSFCRKWELDASGGFRGFDALPLNDLRSKRVGFPMFQESPRHSPRDSELL